VAVTHARTHTLVYSPSDFEVTMLILSRHMISNIDYDLFS